MIGGGLFHASDRVAGAGVGMQDGVHFMRRHVHRGVDREARRIDRVFSVSILPSC